MNSTVLYGNSALAESPIPATYARNKHAPTVLARSISWACSYTTNSIVDASVWCSAVSSSPRSAIRKTLDTIDWKFNTSIDRALVYELATGRFIEQHQDCLILGNPGCGKSHIAQGIGMAAIHAGFRVIYREAHVLFEELLLAAATDERTEAIATYTEIPLLIIDDVGMRKLPAAAAEDLLEIVMRRYERASTIITSNRPLDDWPKLFGDTPAVAAFLDRLMHHSNLIEIRGKSYRLHESSLAARRRKVQSPA